MGPLIGAVLLLALLVAVPSVGWLERRQSNQNGASK